MDPALLTVPDLSMNVESSSSAQKCVTWGHKMIYKSTYLDTLGVEESAPLTTKVHHTSTRHFRNDDNRNSIRRYEDVPGAKPNPLPHSRTLSSGLHDTVVFPHQEMRKEPIDGAQPTQWSSLVKSPKISLRVDDIDGATPAISGSFGPTHSSIRTSRSSNPLSPSYQLPTSPRSEAPIPRFVRDSLNVSDIEKCTPRKTFMSPRKSRLDNSDIEGATPRSRIPAFFRKLNQDSIEQSSLKPVLDTLRVEDINNESKRLPWNFKESNRHVDPLDPRYRYDGPSRYNSMKHNEVGSGLIEAFEIGKVEGVRVQRFCTGAPFYDTPRGRGDTSYRESMLNTADIVGAQCGTKNLFIQRTSPLRRSQFGKTNCIDDIENARPSGPFTLLPAWYRHRPPEVSTMNNSDKIGTPRDLNPATVSQSIPATPMGKAESTLAHDSLADSNMPNNYAATTDKSTFKPSDDRQIASSSGTRDRAQFKSIQLAVSPKQSPRQGISTPRKQERDSQKMREVRVISFFENQV